MFCIQGLKNKYILHSFASAPMNLSGISPPIVNEAMCHGYHISLTTYGPSLGLPPVSIFNWHYTQCIIKKIATIDFQAFNTSIILFSHFVWGTTMRMMKVTRILIPNSWSWFWLHVHLWTPTLTRYKVADTVGMPQLDLWGLPLCQVCSLLSPFYVYAIELRITTVSLCYIHLAQLCLRVSFYMSGLISVSPSHVLLFTFNLLMGYGHQWNYTWFIINIHCNEIFLGHSFQIGSTTPSGNIWDTI